MAELGFSTYVFIERIAANAAALHPFPEHNVALVRDALADAGFEISLLGPDAPEIGEGVYFQPEPFGDEVMGLLADALTLRGMAAIEIRHPEFAAGTAEPMVLLDEIFQVLGAAGFEGITMCNDPGQPAQG